MDKLVANGSNLREVTEPSFGAPVKPPTRTEIRERSATDADATVFLDLIEVMGTTDVSQVYPLGPNEVDF